MNIIREIPRLNPSLEYLFKQTHCLLELCKKPDAMPRPNGMQIKVTHQEIAKMVGRSCEMAGHVMKEPEDDALITAHGKTIVVFGTR